MNTNEVRQRDAQASRLMAQSRNAKTAEEGERLRQDALSFARAAEVVEEWERYREDQLRIAEWKKSWTTNG